MEDEEKIAESEGSFSEKREGCETYPPRESAHVIFRSSLFHLAPSEKQLKDGAGLFLEHRNKIRFLHTIMPVSFFTPCEKVNDPLIFKSLPSLEIKDESPSDRMHIRLSDG